MTEPTPQISNGLGTKSAGENTKMAIMIFVLIIGMISLSGYAGMMIFSGFGSSSLVSEFFILAALSFFSVLLSIIGLVLLSKNNQVGFFVSIISLLILVATFFYAFLFGPAAVQIRNLNRLNSIGGGELITY